jgi:ABC-type multidrug transport system permease subunit
MSEETQNPRLPARYHPLAELTRARILEFLREPEAVFWVFVFPVLLALALGIAFRSKPSQELRVAVVGDGAHARRLADALDRSADLEAVLLDEATAGRQLRTGKVDLIVLGGAEAGAPQTPAGTAGEQLVFRFDPARPEARTARLAVREALRAGNGVPDVTPAREEPVSEPGSRYIDFLIPGLVGLNLMGSGMWGIGFSVVVSRTRKLLKRFAVTPMRRGHYLLSFAFSRLIFLFLEVAAVVGFGWLVFDVHVRGSLLALFLVSLVGAMCFAGLGLLVAARPRTIEAVSGWMNLVMLPMWLLSGTFFSYERFPSFSHTAIRALPLTALNDALRAVVNDGTGLAASWPQLAVMTAWGVCCFVLAVRIFRWQ